jgi:acetolactate decarboxylase
LLGLGVAEAVDGEIVAFDGEVWRVPVDGVPVQAPGSLGMPFAVVAEGGEEIIEELPAGLTFEGITAYIDHVLSLLDKHHDHLVAAVRVDGVFSDVVLRSEPGQTPPYKPITEVLAHEVQFEFTAWTGTLVGFRFPDIDDGEVIPGLHLHALSLDRLSGGHCHRATVVNAVLHIWVDDVEITIPHPSLSERLRA